MKQTPIKSLETLEETSQSSIPTYTYEEFIENKKRIIYNNLQNFFRSKDYESWNPMNRFETRSCEKPAKRRFLNSSIRYIPKKSVSPFNTPKRPEISEQPNKKQYKEKEEELTAKIFISPSKSHDSEEEMKKKREIPILSSTIEKSLKYCKRGLMKSDVEVQFQPSCIDQETQVSPNSNLSFLQNIHIEDQNPVVVEIKRPESFRKSDSPPLSGLYPPIIIEIVKKTSFSVSHQGPRPKNNIHIRSSNYLKNNSLNEQPDLTHSPAKPKSRAKRVSGSYRLRGQKRVKYYSYPAPIPANPPVEKAQEIKPQVPKPPKKVKRAPPSKKITKNTIDSCFQSISKTLEALNTSHQEESGEEFDEEKLLKEKISGPSPLCTLNINNKMKEKAIADLKRDFDTFMNTSYVYHVNPKSKVKRRMEDMEINEGFN